MAGCVSRVPSRTKKASRSRAPESTCDGSSIPTAPTSSPLGANRTTVLKASDARYAEALGTRTVSIPNNSAGSAYAYYAWHDTNGDNLVQPGEVDTFTALGAAPVLARQAWQGAGGVWTKPFAGVSRPDVVLMTIDTLRADSVVGARTRRTHPFSAAC